MSLLTPQATPRVADLLLLLNRVFCFGCALIFSWLFLGVVFENKVYSFNTLAVILSILAWLSATVFLYRSMSRHSGGPDYPPADVAAALQCINCGNYFLCPVKKFYRVPG